MTLQPARNCLAWGVLTLALTGCAPEEAQRPVRPSDTGTSASTSTTSSTSTATGTATGTETTPTWDCSAVPRPPLTRTDLAGLYAAEDFAFDDQGHLITVYQSTMFQQEYPPGDSTPFAPLDGGVGGPASLRMLQDGDIVYANVDTATLYRVTFSGTSTPIHSGLSYPMGIDIHIDGFVYLSDLGGLLRIDPNTGDTELLTSPTLFNFPNGLTFSADYRTLYFGTSDSIMALPMDEAGYPEGPPTLFAAATDFGDFLGMAVDACDNVYAIWDGDKLLRWTADGQGPELLLELDEDAWMSNLQFGSGIGGWQADHLYVTDRSISNPGYYELNVGVGDKPR